MDPLLQAFKDIDGADVEAAVLSCLKATTTTNSGASMPDYRTRLAAVQFVTHYRIGRPREAEPEETKQAESVEAVIERAKSSPSYRAAMIGAYENALERLRALD